MTYYCVYLEVRPDQPWTDDSALVETAISKFLDELAMLHAAVSGDHQGWSAQVTVPGETIDQALGEATTRAVKAAHRAGLPWLPFVRMEVVREDIRDAELEASHG